MSDQPKLGHALAMQCDTCCGFGRLDENTPCEECRGKGQMCDCDECREWHGFCMNYDSIAAPLA